MCCSIKFNVTDLLVVVGAGMLIISAISSIYYNMILAWSLYYMFASWQSQVPWYDCKNSWNTPCKSIRKSIHRESWDDPEKNSMGLDFRRFPLIVDVFFAFTT